MYESPSPSPPESTKLQHELPPKPLSSKEENTRKEYFPISWRVIGGGVRVSGAKGALPRIHLPKYQVRPFVTAGSSDDGVSDLSDDSSEGRAAPQMLEIEIPSSAPSHTVVFPSTNSDADADNSLTPTHPPVRQRATSIPSVPITLHVDHLHVCFMFFLLPVSMTLIIFFLTQLFSAESPGGL
jgi:hypothetical protein